MMTGTRLSQLGLCCLLVVNVLVWSVPSVVPVGKDGQFEELVDKSRQFLVKQWDSPNDQPFAVKAAHSLGVSPGYKPVQAQVGKSVDCRIRISSYPLLPQAPPVVV